MSGDTATQDPELLRRRRRRLPRSIGKRVEDDRGAPL